MGNDVVTDVITRENCRNWHASRLIEAQFIRLLSAGLFLTFFFPASEIACPYRARGVLRLSRCRRARASLETLGRLRRRCSPRAADARRARELKAEIEAAALQPVATRRRSAAFRANGSPMPKCRRLTGGTKAFRATRNFLKLIETTRRVSINQLRSTRGGNVFASGQR